MGKGAGFYAWQPEVDFWPPHGGRRELILENCLLASTCALKRVNPYTHMYKDVIKKSDQLIKFQLLIRNYMTK